MIAAIRTVDLYAAQIRLTRNFFEHAALAHKEAPAADMRSDAIHADAQYGTDVALVLSSQQRS